MSSGRGIPHSLSAGFGCREKVTFGNSRAWQLAREGGWPTPLMAFKDSSRAIDTAKNSGSMVLTQGVFEAWDMGKFQEVEDQGRENPKEFCCKMAQMVANSDVCLHPELKLWKLLQENTTLMQSVRSPFFNPVKHGGHNIRHLIKNSICHCHHCYKMHRSNDGRKCVVHMGIHKKEVLSDHGSLLSVHLSLSAPAQEKNFSCSLLEKRSQLPSSV